MTPQEIADEAGKLLCHGCLSGHGLTLDGGNHILLGVPMGACVAKWNAEQVLIAIAKVVAKVKDAAKRVEKSIHAEGCSEWAGCVDTCPEVLATVELEKAIEELPCLP